MFRPRIIPVLLLDKDHLVKSRSFKHHRYIGDPINAVRIFSEQRADELVFLDISATRNHRCISTELIKSIGEEAEMPFSAGGGIRKLSQIKEIISAGAERVIIGAYAAINPNFIANASDEFGASTISVCIDVKRDAWGNQEVRIINGTQSVTRDPLKFAQLMEEKGAGEIIIQSINRDGRMNGYDLELVKMISKNIRIPTIALGGAGTMHDLQRAHTEGWANGLGAGSLFIYFGRRKGVLINYPDKQEMFEGMGMTNVDRT